MKRFAIGTAVGLLLAMVGFQLQRLADVSAQQADSLDHQQSTFDFVVNAPYSAVAPLFGAEGERTWGGADWNPHFVYPSPPRDIAGAVFTVNRNGHEALWIMPIFDLPGRHIQYLILVPHQMVTQLDITFTEAGAKETRVYVSHQRTALDASFNQHLRSLAAEDPAAAKEWQSAINAYISSEQRQ